MEVIVAVFVAVAASVSGIPARTSSSLGKVLYTVLSEAGSNLFPLTVTDVAVIDANVGSSFIFDDCEVAFVSAELICPVSVRAALDTHAVVFSNRRCESKC
jgi:hypothetical protein